MDNELRPKKRITVNYLDMQGHSRRDVFEFMGLRINPNILFKDGTGRRGPVYQLKNLRDNILYALKTFYPDYRHKNVAEGAKWLAKYKDLPGMVAAGRTAITKQENLDVINEFCDFEYALLIPWISGQSWSESYIGKRKTINKNESLRLTWAMVKVLIELEKKELAHCDLSSSNFIILDQLSGIELIDLEEMYPIVPKPPILSPGTPIYVPERLTQNGLWSSWADRYAGGILLSEMLAWRFDDFRQAAVGGGFFKKEDHGQVNSSRYKIMKDSLFKIKPELAALFDKIWFCHTIEECPSFADWKRILPPEEELLYFCFYCHHAIDKNWEFCPFCGSSLKINKCPKGHIMQPGWKFCPYCAPEHTKCPKCGREAQPEWIYCPYVNCGAYLR